MSCGVIKQHYVTADVDGLEVWERTNEYQRIREIEYERRRKGYVDLTDEEMATHDSCDGRYHYRHYGRVPLRTFHGSNGRHTVDVSFSEVIVGFCPDYAERNPDTVTASRMFAANVADPWRDLHQPSVDAPAFTAARKFYSSILRTFIITGACGYGKTTMARAIMGDCSRANGRPQFVSCEKLAEIFLAAQPTANEIDMEARQAVLDMKSADLLVIDDLGTAEKEYTEFFKEKLKMLLDERKGKLVITTNLDRTQLEKKLNDKIVSRIFEKMKAVHLKGKDYRRAA
jgi:nucleoside-triphosphatase THEP1